MLGPAWFDLGGDQVQPFAIAPWAEDTGAAYEGLPRLLQRLRGEWPCVPFGIARPGSEIPEAWRPCDTGPSFSDPQPHGFSSNALWQLDDLAENRIELSLPYPEPHPVRRLKRVIRASTTDPLIELRLRVEMREASALPIGLHPTFRLPVTPRRAVLHLGAAACAWTPPIPLEPGIMRFIPDAREVRPDRIPLVGGVKGPRLTEDITRLPLPYAAEEVVLITNHLGHVTLHNLDERYAVTLCWDSEVFPACQLWLSNYGRDYYPWNGRFLALGIEPIRAAFDLGVEASRNLANPLSQVGIPSTVILSPDKPLETTYTIAVSRGDSL